MIRGPFVSRHLERLLNKLVRWVRASGATSEDLERPAAQRRSVVALDDMVDAGLATKAQSKRPAPVPLAVRGSVSDLVAHQSH